MTDERRRENESSLDIEEVQRQLLDVESEIRETRLHLLGAWGTGVGRIRLVLPLRSGHFFLVYSAFCLATLVGGAALTLFSATKELGIALVVGAVFAGGSFVAQVWTVQIAKEHEIGELFEEAMRDQIRELLRRREKLERRIRSMDLGEVEPH